MLITFTSLKGFDPAVKRREPAYPEAERPPVGGLVRPKPRR